MKLEFSRQISEEKKTQISNFKFQQNPSSGGRVVSMQTGRNDAANGHFLQVSEPASKDRQRAITTYHITR